MASSFNHFNQIADALPQVLSQVVRKTAFDVQAGAVRRAPVDTGFLRASIYVKTFNESTYGQGSIKAKRITRKARRKAAASLSGLTSSFSTPYGYYLLPEVEAPDNEQTAYVAVGAEYGIYLEFGTRYMPARPYFYASVEHVRPSFEAALSRIEDKLKEAAG
jgi:hypothetical protein